MSKILCIFAPKLFDMKVDKPAVKVMIDKSKMKDGKCPTYININWNKTRAKEFTGDWMTLSEYKRGKWKTPSVLKRLSEIEETIESLKPPFTAKDCLSKKTEKSFLQVAFEKVKSQHLSEGTQSNYLIAENILRKYLGDDYVMSKVTSDDLSYIARKMKEDNYKIGGIATVMKNLKAVFSYAENKKYFQSPFKDYNFKSDGYRFADNPRALSRVDVAIIREWWEKRKVLGCGVWLFSYYFCGLSLVDIMGNDWSKIDVEVYNGQSYYVKTIFRKKSNEKASIVVQRNMLTEELLRFINTRPWDGLTKDCFCQRCNHSLKKINPNYTLYTARHTFCTMLVGSHIPINRIASMMGRSPNTLATYIKTLTEVSDLSKAADAVSFSSVVEEF